MISSQNKQEHSPVTEIYHFSGYSISLRQDNIIQLDFERSFNVNIEDARNQVEIFKKLMGGRKCRLLVLFKEDNMLTRETREFISSDTASQVIAADALVIKGLAMRILANGYMKINKPNRPTRLFSSVKPAVDWLHGVV
jgi:hypothetical protein